jgi:hypothetical protein
MGSSCMVEISDSRTALAGPTFVEVARVRRFLMWVFLHVFRPRKDFRLRRSNRKTGAANQIGDTHGRTLSIKTTRR